MINIHNIESKLGLQFFQGGGSGSSNKSNPQLTPQQLIDVYNQNLPQTLATTVGQAGSTANALANAAAGANPIYTQSGLNQLQQLAPGYQQAGANLATQQAQSTAGILNGAGGQAAQAATNLSNTLNPTQANAQNQANNLLNSINLQGLSPGEANATERSLNQTNTATGNLGLINPTNTVSNAMNFGGAFNQKLGALNQALGTASNVAANQNTFVNPVGTAIGSANTASNFGLGTFAPTQANNTITAPLTFGSSIFSPTASNASSQNSSGGSSSAQGGICFITTVCCEYMGGKDDCEILTILRHFRNTYVPRFLVKEYYELQPILEPKLRKRRDIMARTYYDILKCVKDIQEGKNESGLNRYTHLVQELKEEFSQHTDLIGDTNWANPHNVASESLDMPANPGWQNPTNTQAGSNTANQTPTIGQVIQQHWNNRSTQAPDMSVGSPLVTQQAQLPPGLAQTIFDTPAPPLQAQQYNSKLSPEGASAILGML